MQFVLFRRRRERPVVTEFPLPEGFSANWWRVRWNSIKPPGHPMHVKFLLSWLLYIVRGQRRTFSVLTIRDARGKVVHASMLFPGWFKSPFMGDTDIEIGRVYTEPRSRDLGLAKYGVQECLRHASSAGGWCWYVVRPENGASIRVAEANEFARFGFANKRPWFGIKKLGRLVADDVEKAFRPKQTLVHAPERGQGRGP